MSDNDAMFQHGTATVVNVRGKYAMVACPHCQGRHAHDRASIGSRAVLAGCSRPGTPRTYAIPAATTQGRKR